MVKKNKWPVLLWWGLLSVAVQAQTDFFHQIELTKDFYEKDNLTMDASARWKHIYADVGWRRWGVTGMATLNRGQWYFNGGLAIFYTFDKDINNFLEIRPRLGLGLKTDITDRFKMDQRILGEYRAFIYTGDNNLDSYLRSRYRIQLNYTIYENPDNKAAWNFKPSVEWYFTRDDETGIRYAQSAYFAFDFVRKFKNRQQLSIGYRYQKFKLIEERDKNGNVIMLQYHF